MKPFSFTSIKPAQIFLIFSFFALLTYGNAVNYPFVHDDVVFIVNNPNIKSFALKDIFKPKEIEGPASELVNVYYRPLIELVYRIQYKLFGFQSYAYHSFNIVIHLINTFLLYIFLRKIFPSRINSNFLIALFFLIHPVQTEAVACISGISNLLLSLVMFSGLLLYLISREYKNKGHYIGALILSLIHI